MTLLLIALVLTPWLVGLAVLVAGVLREVRLLRVEQRGPVPDNVRVLPVRDRGEAA